MFNPLSTTKHLIVDKRLLKSLLVAIPMVVLVSCGDGEKAPDVSDVKVALNKRRLDKDITAIDTNNIAAGLQQLQSKYPDFLPFFLDTLMGLGIQGNYNDTVQGIKLGMRSFLTHKDYRGLLDTVAKHYPDTKEVDEWLQKGFQYHKHYFPNTNERKVVYMISWLNNWGAFTYDSTILGIGLDMFLGASYPYYKAVGVPEYWSAQLQKEYIPVAAFKAMYRDNAAFDMEGKTLLHMMIQRGKEAYYVEKVLPFVPKHIRLAYTDKQLKWCEENEAGIYNFFIAQNFLYETSLQKVVRYVMEGPSAAGMSNESPGEVGTFIGLHIVKSYMAQHPDMTLDKLLALPIDEQRFLQESKYKPK
ncbi:hypothetical protein CAP35_11270 [Chitinophagaceae bacterium IBVUCB1]|nr:hypothetical protein CAP35_11270 [Chitinophagaceae bacterium IBVUCB1]